MSDSESFDADGVLDMCVTESGKTIDKGDLAKKLLEGIYMLRRDFYKGCKTEEEMLNLVDEVDELILKYKKGEMIHACKNST